MHQEVEAVITLSESRGVCQLQYQSMNQSRKNVEMVRQIVESEAEYSQYRTAIEKWKKETGKEPVAHSIRAKLAEKKQEIQNEQKNKQHTRSQNKDRGAR